MTNNQIAYQRLLQEKDLKGSELELQRQSLAETQRSNLAKEIETNRSNVVNEDLKRYHEQITADHYARSDSLGESRLAADIYHNQQVRDETARSNVSREQETSRHNAMSEMIASQQLDRDYITSTAESVDKAVPGAGAIVSAVGGIARRIIERVNSSKSSSSKVGQVVMGGGSVGGRT